MTSVLVVDDELDFRTAMARDLEKNGFDVCVAQSFDEAVGVLGARAIDVMLTDLRMPGRDGIDLLAAAQTLSRGTSTILMSAFASARDYEAAVDLGVVRVLVKPFSRSQLFLAIEEAMEAKMGFRGSVHGLSLIDLLQMFHYGRRAVTLTVRGRGRGRIHVQQGEIVGAECEGLTGEAALRAVLGSPSGVVHTSALAEGDRSVARPFQELMLDTLRELDESAAVNPHELSFEEPPPSMVDRALQRPFGDLDAALSHIIPSAKAALFSNGAPPSDVRNAPDALDLVEPVEQFSQCVTELAPAWTAIECSGDGGGFALLVQEGSTLLVAEAFRDRHAPRRFRAAIQRLAQRSLGEGTKEGESHGKDR